MPAPFKKIALQYTGLALMLLGAAGFICGLGQAVHLILQQRSCLRAQAVVIRVDSGTAPGAQPEFPVFTFNDDTGAPYIVTSETSNREAAIGDTIAILYKRDSHKDARIEVLTDRWETGGVPGLLGLLASALGVYCLWLVRRDRLRRQREAADAAYRRGEST